MREKPKGSLRWVKDRAFTLGLIATGEKEPTMRVLLLIPAMILAGIVDAKAERVGDPQAGYTYAKEVCSTCHGISAEKSPLPQATRFREIADRPGITGTALAVWLQTTHPTMPNIIVEKQDMWNVIAYILELKGRDQK